MRMGAVQEVLQRRFAKDLVRYFGLVPGMKSEVAVPLALRGDVIGALVEAGFDYSFLREGEIGFFDPWNHPDILEKHSDDHWRFKEDQVRFPLSYTLKMTRPG